MNLAKTNKNIFSIMFLSVFLSYYIRLNFLNNVMATVNIIFILALISYRFFNRKNRNILMSISITFVIVYVLIVDFLGNKNGFGEVLKNVCMFFVPLYLLTINPDIDDKKGIITKVLKIFNFFITIIFIIGIIDPITNLSITNFFIEYLTPEISNWIKFDLSSGLYRYTSFMGHSLFTKELFMYYFLLNTLYGKVYGEKVANGKVVMMISLIGVLLTGSKSGILLIIACILVLKENGKSNLKYYITIGIFFFIAYGLGLFNTVLLRFQTTTLTTGRAEWWQYIKDFRFIEYRFFSGYGERIYNIIADKVGDVYATAGLEYPIRVLYLKYGLLCLIIILLLILYPLITFIKDKQFYIAFACAIKLVEVSTYNGLVSKADNMILLVLFMYILMMMSIDNKKIQKIKLGAKDFDK